MATTKKILFHTRIVSHNLWKFLTCYKHWMTLIDLNYCFYCDPVNTSYLMFVAFNAPM